MHYYGNVFLNCVITADTPSRTFAFLLIYDMMTIFKDRERPNGHQCHDCEIIMV